jgi:hypothetical protein
MIKGHCECGRVQYQVAGEINDFSHCHCSQCRRLHGAAFASFGGVARDGFSYLSGQSDLATYASSDSHVRVFCRNCGSNILVDLEAEPEALYLAMGTVDGDPDCPPGYHIFVGSKAPWYSIEDQLAQYDTAPEEDDD